MDSILHTCLPFYNLCGNFSFTLKVLITEVPYIADQNTLVTIAIVRKLQFSEFEVSKKGSICSFH